MMYQERALKAEADTGSHPSKMRNGKGSGISGARIVGPMMTVAYTGVLLFCILYFFRPEDFIPALASVPMEKIVGSIAALALGLEILSGSVRWTPETKLLLALFAYLCLCIPTSLWKGGSYDIIINGFSKGVIIAIATMTAVTTVGRLKKLAIVQTLAMLIMVFVAHAQGLSNGRMFGYGKMFGDPNDFALQLCIVLPFCVALALSSRFWPWKLLWTAGVLLALFGIVSTYSRGGFLALIAVLVAVFVKFRVNAFALISLFLVVIVASAITIMAVGPSTYFDRMKTISDPQADASGSAEIHKALLIKSLEVSLAHPIFGVGPGQFMQVSGSWHQSHNTYTELSSEAGFPSLIIFLWIMIRTYRNLQTFQNSASKSQEWYLARALHCALVGYLVGGFFLGTAYWLVPYLLVAYASALRAIGERSRAVVGTGAVENHFRNPRPHTPLEVTA